MRKAKWAVSFAAFSIFVIAESEKPKAKTFTANCANGDCPILKGKPQTAGMRGGSVSLKPGESVGWHSTAGNEEALVILRGIGVAKIDGQADMPLAEKTMAYIPPATRHNVTNTGMDVLDYVWIVAPAADEGR